ncbi:hypothetical protein NM688_g5175 [Phlebia brevispora]|uniref:Uncharacterized protein n=1 Tax=Phlebia brevispora TaxID=194682 RepID=A0ACC1SZG0_9APHY|nr:hypothetical protein NM688_g5175 [Phlebia brevispora]
MKPLVDIESTSNQLASVIHEETVQCLRALRERGGADTRPRYWLVASHGSSETTFADTDLVMYGALWKLPYPIDGSGGRTSTIAALLKSRGSPYLVNM